MKPGPVLQMAQDVGLLPKEPNSIGTEIGTSVAKAVGGLVSPESIAIMTGAELGGAGLELAANSAKVVKALENVPHPELVLKAVALAAKNAIPVSFIANQLKASYDAAKQGEVGDAVVNGLFAVAGILGVKGSAERTTAEFPPTPTPEAKAKAAETGGIATPQVTPEQAQAAATELKKGGQRLAAKAWENLDRSQPVPITVSGQQYYLKPPVITKSGAYNELVDAQGNTAVGGSGEVVRGWINQRGGNVGGLVSKTTPTLGPAGVAMAPAETLTAVPTQVPAAQAQVAAVGSVYELPTGRVTVTKSAGGKVEFTRELPDGTSVQQSRPTVIFNRMVAGAAPAQQEWIPESETPSATVPVQPEPANAAPTPQSIATQAPVPATPTKAVVQKPAEAVPETAGTDLDKKIAGMKLPDYVKDTLREDVGRAQDLGLVEKIEELSAQRKTANEVTNALNIPNAGETSLDAPRIVRSVRAVLGIPSMDDKTEFEKWLSSRSAKPADNITSESKTAKPTIQESVDRAETLKPEVASTLAAGSTRTNPNGTTQELKEIDLSDILPAQPTEARPEGNVMYPETVAKYVKNPTPVAPEVNPSTDGTFFITHDGHHRIEAAKQRGETSILAWVTKEVKSAKPQASLQPRVGGGGSEVLPLQEGVDQRVSEPAGPQKPNVPGLQPGNRDQAAIPKTVETPAKVVAPVQPEPTKPADAFRMKGSQLQDLAKVGDTGAQAELDRRAGKRGEPVKAEAKAPAATSTQADLADIEKRMGKRREAYVKAQLAGETTRAQTTTYNAEMGRLAERRDALQKMETVPTPKGTAPPSRIGPSKAVAEMLRKGADSLQTQIDAKRNSGIFQQNPTRRRNQMGEGIIKDAERLERIQKGMRALAELHATGEAPPILSGIKSRSALESILPSYHEHGPERGTRREARFPSAYVSSYPAKEIIEKLQGTKGNAEGKLIFLKAQRDGSRLTEKDIPFVEAAIDAAEKKGFNGKSLRESLTTAKRLYSIGINEANFKQAVDAVEALGIKKREPTAEEKIAKAERELAIGSKIEGFFPTPKPLAKQMVEDADIKPGMSVLEPSAGNGNIADAIREAGVEPDVIEPYSSLRSILQAKKHNLIGSDFLDEKGKYDRIVMNPPFERGQDMDHVQHAYELLKPGGRVVAIMSEGSFFRGDKKATAFREWLDEHNGTDEKLPEGSFTGKDAMRQTGVAARMVVIDKPAEKAAKSEQVSVDGKTLPLFMRGQEAEATGPVRTAFRNGILWVNSSGMKKLAEVFGSDAANGMYIPSGKASGLLSKIPPELRPGVTAALKVGPSITVVRMNPGESISQSKAKARHELFHAAETWGGEGRANDLLEHPLAQRASALLAGGGYDASNQALMFSEIGAHLASGPIGWEAMGLDENEAEELFKRYLELLDDKTVSNLNRVAPQLKKELHAERSIRAEQADLGQQGGGESDEAEGGSEQGAEGVPRDVPEDVQPGQRYGNTGEAKPSRLAERMTPGEGPEYEVMNRAAQIKAAKNIMDEDPQRAIDIAMMKRNPPDGLTPQAFLVVAADYARDTKNSQLLLDLSVNSGQSERATKMGQEISMLAEIDMDNPVVLIRKVADAREEAVTKRIGAKTKENIKKSLKSQVKAARPKKDEWSRFIESLKCP